MLSCPWSVASNKNGGGKLHRITAVVFVFIKFMQTNLRSLGSCLSLFSSISRFSLQGKQINSVLLKAPVNQHKSDVNSHLLAFGSNWTRCTCASRGSLKGKKKKKKCCTCLRSGAAHITDTRNFRLKLCGDKVCAS